VQHCTLISGHFKYIVHYYTTLQCLFHISFSASRLWSRSRSAWLSSDSSSSPPAPYQVSQNLTLYVSKTNCCDSWSTLAQLRSVSFLILCGTLPVRYQLVAPLVTWYTPKPPRLYLQYLPSLCSQSLWVWRESHDAELAIVERNKNCGTKIDEKANIYRRSAYIQHGGKSPFKKYTHPFIERTLSSPPPVCPHRTAQTLNG
jgi:hypothetical protein